MPLKYNGAALAAAKYNGVALAAAKRNGVEGYSAAPPPPPSLITTMDLLRFRTDVLSASEFNIITAADATKYRQNGSTNIGTLIDEYRAQGVTNDVPQVRGMRVTSSTALELRSYGGDLSGRDGVNYTFSGWGTWDPMDSSTAQHCILFIDFEEREWFSIRPSFRNSRSGGGTWANWTGGLVGESWATSFANAGAGNTYLDGFRGVTVARRFIVVVMENHDYVPVFV